jgi:RHS repeat-associated protein
MLVENGFAITTDRLGTVRVNANANSNNIQYYPYGGEQTTGSTEGVAKFATYTRDGVGQDYAEQRYYNAGMGRFWSPDPGGVKTASPETPITWNRYAYANGDPQNFNDQHGLWAQLPPCIDAPDPTACGYDPICDSSLGFVGNASSTCDDDSGGGTGDDTTPACDPISQSWIDAHGTDAVTIEGKLGDPTTGKAGIQGEADILTLSAMESAWGASFFARTTNNYFSLEEAVPCQYCVSKWPGLLPYSIGWSAAVRRDGKWWALGKYTSYLKGGLSFATQYAKFLGGHGSVRFYQRGSGTRIQR